MRATLVHPVFSLLQEPKLARDTPTAARRKYPLSAASRTSSGLALFNRAPAGTAEAALLTCCGSPRWARLVAGHRPYPDPAALLAAADEASYDLSPGDLAEALSRESAFPLPPHPCPAAHTALSAAHAAYEARFGHVFVVCLDGVPPAEQIDQVLAGIHDRYDNDPDEERAIAADELRQLAQARLLRLAGAV